MGNCKTKQKTHYWYMSNSFREKNSFFRSAKLHLYRSPRKRIMASKQGRVSLWAHTAANVYSYSVRDRARVLSPSIANGRFYSPVTRKCFGHCLKICGPMKNFQKSAKDLHCIIRLNSLLKRPDNRVIKVITVQMKWTNPNKNNKKN